MPLRYHWAFFVKYLMNNTYTASKPPDYVKKMEMELEDARLGTVLNNAMNCRYETADEIITDVKVAALAAGIQVIDEDEVEIDERWEQVFEVRGRELHFRAR
jgi:hypothetical protein